MPSSTTPQRERIVIDPGHNGANSRHTKEINRQVDAGGLTKACNTTGTAGGDYSEALFNWELSLRVRDLLVERGHDVVMTRDTNDGWGPCVDERGRIAATADAALMVSIHADGSSVGNRGFHVIHPGVVPGYTDGVVDSSTAAPHKWSPRHAPAWVQGSPVTKFTARSGIPSAW